MDSRELRIIYGQLIELRHTLNSIETPNVEPIYGEIIQSLLESLINKGVSDVDHLSNVRDIQLSLPNDFISRSSLMLISGQAIAVLEYGYGLKDQIVEIGSLYNSIKDYQLRERCADLLVSDANFDRVINQATLVLEDRLRKKVGGSDLTGTQLSNKYIKSDVKLSPIVFAGDSEEQKGYADLIRGIFLALRNGTHHQISDDFTREDAFAACAFIDRLLRKLDAAAFRKDL